MRVAARPPRWVAAGLVVLYVGLFPYHPRLRSPNELCRLWQTRALVEYGTLELNEALRDYGWVGDLSVHQGRYYPSKAPLLSLAAVPPYALLRAWGGGFRYAVPEVPLVFWTRLLLTVLPTLVMLVAVRRFLGAYLEPRVADAVVVTYGLGSLAFSYSLLFMSHQPTAVLLFGCFYALWRVGRGEWRERGYALAGAYAGAAVATEYTGALGVLALAAYGAVSVLGREEPLRPRLTRLARGAGLALLGALPFVAGLLLYHQAAYGHPLESGYKHLNDSAYQPWHVGGFLGIGLPEKRALVLSFFSPLRGLFTLSPFLLLGVPGLWLLWRQGRTCAQQRGLFWLSAGALAAYTYFTSAFAYESWGWTTGPRHLTGLVPFLLLPVGRVLERARGWQAGAASALCAASILFTGVATCVNYVPDDVSSVLLGLAMPLLRDGFLPPSVLVFLGVPNPWAGWVLLAVLAVLAGWVFLRLATGQGQRPGWQPVMVGLGVLGALLATQAAAEKHPAADAAAVRLLQQVWLAPPGRAVPFWPGPEA